MAEGSRTCSWARSGSWQRSRISARTSSRSLTAASKPFPFAPTGFPTRIEIEPRCGNHWPLRNIERVPLMVTGTTGTSVWAATRNAPIWKASRPGILVSVPSGNETIRSPALTAANVVAVSSKPPATSDRLTNNVPRRLRNGPAINWWASSSFATNASGPCTAARIATLSK